LSITYASSCVFFTYFWGLRGLLIGLLLSDFLVSLFIILITREIPSLRINLPILRNLFNIGFPIMLIALVFILLRSIDRIIIANLLPHKMLGYFGVGTILSGVVFASISDLAAIVFAPRVMEKLGRTGDIQQLKNYFIEPTLIIAYCSPFIISILFLGIPIPIHYFLPDYLPTIPVAQILILGAFFNAIMMIPAMVCIAINKQVHVVGLMMVAVVVNGILSYLFIYLGMGIDGVAIGTSISYFALSFLVIQFAMKQFKMKMKEFLGFIILVYAPFIYTAILFFTLKRYCVTGANDLSADVLQTLTIIIIFSFIYSLIFILVRKQSAFQSLFHILKNLKEKFNATVL